MTEHQKGLLLTFLGGLLLSLDIPILRLGDGDVWSAMLTRSAATVAVTLVAWAVMRQFLSNPPPLIDGRTGLAVAALYGVTSVFFILSVFNTTTANVAFILAFNPMFGAILSWLFLRERIRPATLIAMAVMFGGLLLIVGDGMEAGHSFGDAMAALSAFTAAAAITLSRAHGGNFGLSPLLSTVFPAVIAAFFVADTGFNMAAPGWVLLNGLIVTPLAFYLLAIGPQRLSAPEVGMFYLIETILAPVWVWLIFDDKTSLQVLIGGAIVLAALLAHSFWTMRYPGPAATAGH